MRCARCAAAAWKPASFDTPSVLFAGEVIDGRKREAACRQLGTRPKTVELEPGADPAAAARSLNILRTHYTASQRALFAATRANASKADHIPKSRDVKIVTVEQGVSSSSFPWPDSRSPLPLSYFTPA